MLSKIDPANYDALDGVPFPCGQCLPCRINKRRVWTLRLMLESFQHEHSVFITLTYRNEDIRYDRDKHPTLDKRDLQLFFKRLRKSFTGNRIRYYACGEYGEKTGRPHYHAIIFGLDPSDLDAEWLLYAGKSGLDYSRHRHSRLARLWPWGIVHVGACTRESIQYVAGYVTKKITKGDTDSRVKEFALMSRKPGIGATAVESIADALKDVSESDFTGQLRIDGKKWPIGRYLLTKLSDALGYTGNLECYLNELADLYRKSKATDAMDFISYVTSVDDQRFKQLESRDRLFNHRDFEV